MAVKKIDEKHEKSNGDAINKNKFRISRIKVLLRSEEKSVVCLKLNMKKNKKFGSCSFCRVIMQPQEGFQFANIIIIII